MSQHSIEIVTVGPVLPHPNADRLAITQIWGWQCCVGKDDFAPGDKAIYIPPDYVVPTTRPEFAFLPDERNGTHRVRVKRLRGQLSQGLLIPVPPALADLPVGTNVIEQLGVVRYEPPTPPASTHVGGPNPFVSGPSGVYTPKFDVESYQRYADEFTPGERVIITEKLHGANARYVFARAKGGEMQQFCGSRVNWITDPAQRKYDEAPGLAHIAPSEPPDIWWRAFGRYPAIGKWCQAHPEALLYGEIFGNVKELRYGADKDTLFFAAFAVLQQARWWDYGEMRRSLQEYDVPMAPLLLVGSLPPQDELARMAAEDSVWPGAKHMREGIVIVPEHERTSQKIGRVCLKYVSDRYMEKCR